MKIFTSHFFGYGGSDAVSIALTSPGNFKGRLYRKLNPPHWLIRAYRDSEIDSEEYSVLYTEEVLSELDPNEVLKDLGDGAVLVCWEKSGEFCHRHLVADWLKYHTGVEVEEI